MTSTYEQIKWLQTKYISPKIWYISYKINYNPIRLTLTKTQIYKILQYSHKKTTYIPKKILYIPIIQDQNTTKTIIIRTKQNQIQPTQD